MPTHVPIRVVPVTPTLAAGVRAIELGREQSMFVGDVAFNLDDALRDDASEAMAVIAGDRPIGFYRLDFAPRAVLGRALGMPHVGLRAFCIDHRLQGIGLGHAAVSAMIRDVPRRHAERRLMVLAVHCRNRAAIATYRRAGFVATGEWQPGGRAGPQQLMWLALDAARPSSQTPPQEPAQ
ncbi:GNAT family N-acetyltransferase [Solilutibacter pythonis]|nr:GNAT family N-acetyltransferase [Lysobacter pythonis]